MTRRDWDRLRRHRPLDGADPRVDPDGAVVWERETGSEREADTTVPRNRLDARYGVRWLRAGIVVRRAQSRREAEGGAERKIAPAPPPPRPPLDASSWVECPRCKARVARRKLLLHARAACSRRG